MLERVGPRTLVIVPGDREDAILTVAAAHAGDGADGSHALRHLEPLVDSTPGAVIDRALEGRALGLVLTGGYEPREEVVHAIQAAGMFASRYLRACAIADCTASCFSTGVGSGSAASW